MPAQGSRTAVPDRSESGSGLIERLEITRADMHTFQRARCLLTTLLIILLLAGLLAAADWLWDLGTSVRAGGLLALGGVAVVLLVRGLVARRSLGRPDAAVEVETAFPKLGQRVRTALEYTEPTPATMQAAPGLVTVLETDAERCTRGLDLRGLVPWRSLRLLRAALVGVLTLFAVLLLANGQWRIAALRLFLVPVHFTQLDVAPGDCALPVGSDLTIQAALKGRPVSTAALRYRKAGGEDEWSSLPFTPDTKPRKLLGTLETTLHNCQDDLEYRVVAGPVESPIYHVKVLHPLVLEQIETTVEPPAYTRKLAATSKEGNVKVIAGSQLRLQVTLDRAPQAARLVIHPAGTKDKPVPDATVPLQIQGSVLTGEPLTVVRELEYEIVAEAADGMKLGVNRFKIEVTPDRKPTIRFLKPREQIEVTPSTEVHMRIEATDDFGLSRTGIVYQVGNGPQKTLFLQQDPNQPATLRAEAVLPLEDHEVNFQDGVTYYAFTEDNHPDRPQRATTELQFIDIRPYKRAYQLLEQGGSCNGCSTTLEELIARQRDNLKHTFALSEQTKPDPRAVEKLAQAERELSEAAAEFTAGIEARAGPVPPLDEAVSAMRSATEELARQQLTPARGFEETALANLIKARANIRKFLSQSSSASACRKFDQEQRQKLRLPPKKDDEAEQAKLQEEIEKLAQEEKKVGQEIARKSGKASETILSERQEKAAAKAEQLKQLVRDNEKLTDLALQRMDKAAEKVRSSADSLKQGRASEAGKQAADAAEQLERLVKQVAALTAPDAMTRLAHGQNMARQLAREQEKLDKDLRDRAAKTKGDQATKERGLSEEARTLADLLEKLQPEVEADNPQLGRDLRQAVEANSPSAAAGRMQRAADALQAGKLEQASRDVNESGRTLHELAQHLDSARRAALQPQLQKLLAAEKQAAETKKALDGVANEQQKAQAERKVAELRDALDALKISDAKLAEATDALDHAVRGNASSWQRRDPRLGTYVPPREYDENVRRAVQALQAKIQDIILRDILLDKDEPVPPQFKALVEEYYRVLSDDAR